MKKLILSIILGTFLLTSCNTIGSVQTSDIVNDTIHHTQTDYIHQTITKDSVVIRDSIVMKADGSKDSYHSEKIKSNNVEKVYYNIVEHKKITYTVQKTLQVTKEVQVHGIFWWLGFILSGLFIAGITYKVLKFFKVV